MPKYFFDPQQIVGDTITIEGQAAHHMMHVLRMAPGDRVTLCDGAETDYTATIETIKKTQITFALSDKRPCLTEPAARIVLYQSMPKGDKMELIIQKCVELGVHKVIPVMASHCVVRIKDTAKKVDRYQLIAESAAGQSMRGIVPQVSRAVPFEDAVNQMDNSGQTLVAHEQEDERTLVDALAPANVINIWIGPEGGFTNQEISLLKSHGATAVSLGQRILRTETAAIAAIALVSQISAATHTMSDNQCPATIAATSSNQ